jgi:hypothetical protein
MSTPFTGRFPMAKTDTITPHAAMLLALEAVGRARALVEKANPSFQKQDSYTLYETIMADLDVTSKQMQSLLAFTSVRV